MKDAWPAKLVSFIQRHKQNCLRKNFHELAAEKGC